jgi:PAS domain S-box-containing protein
MSDVLARRTFGLRKQFFREHQGIEQLYHSLFEHNPDAVYALDLDGRFLGGNAMCEKLTGYLLEELRSMSFVQFIEPNMLEATLYHFRQAAEGNLQEYETTIVHKQGHSIEVYIKNFPIVADGQIAGVYAITRDITHDIQKKEKLRESEERYRLIAEHSSDMITKFSPDGICLYASPACYPLLGYVPDDLLGHSLFEFIHPDDVQALGDLHQMLLAEGRIFTVTNRIKSKAGEFKWVETTCKGVHDERTGRIREFIGISRDIHERKNAEEELRKREKRYRRLVEHSPETVMICRDGLIVYINKAGMKLLGAGSKEELVGRPLFSFIQNDYHDTIMEQLQKVTLDEEVELIEQKFIRLDGKIIDVEVKGIATIYKDQPAVHVIVRDITERKRTQELLQNSEKLTLVGQLAAGIAHEIRNPLTSLKGFLQLMQTDGREKQEYFSIMSSELTRIELIVSELLVLAKPHSTSFKERDLANLLRHVVTLLDTEAILKKVQIQLILETEIPPICCDENQLKQAFINFLKNSIEAMPNGGDIVIGVRRHGDQVVIRFEDSGVGIPEELIPKLGEPFYTTKEKGTGLGLMISYRIIQNHRGHVRMMSKQGEGTVVEVTIPAN